jgi:protein TonB
VHGLWVLLGAAGLTALFFLVLPLIQAITQGGKRDLIIAPADTVAGQEPPPPPPPEEEPEEEEPEEEELELEEQVQPLSLDQLAAALDVGGGGSGFLGGDLAIRLNALGGGEDGDSSVAFTDLDQEPRKLYTPAPVLDARARARTPGKVVLLFIVDERGRVQNPRVQSSSDPIFERPALAAVRRWRFEPGKRESEPVSFRMKLPMSFPKQ